VGDGGGALEEVEFRVMTVGLPINPTSLRLVLAAVAGVVLLYWTAERALGQGSDPTIQRSYSSDTGSMSFLVSGVKAVGMVAGVVLAALYGLPGLSMAPLVENQGLVLVAIALVVVAHWYYEKEEREA